MEVMTRQIRIRSAGCIASDSLKKRAKRSTPPKIAICDGWKFPKPRFSQLLAPKTFTPIKKTRMRRMTLKT
jgi:hypothetical protein